jgi:hypothetical protein
MSFLLKFGDNAALAIGCGIILLLAIIFFIVVYVADFKDSRRKAKRRREFERSLARAHRRRQKAH